MMERKPRPDSEGGCEVSLPILSVSDLPDGWDELEADKTPSSSEKLWPRSPWGGETPTLAASNSRSNVSLGSPHPFSLKGPPSTTARGSSGQTLPHQASGAGASSVSPSSPLTPGGSPLLLDLGGYSSGKSTTHLPSAVGRSTSSGLSSSVSRPGAPLTKFRSMQLLMSEG